MKKYQYYLRCTYILCVLVCLQFTLSAQLTCGTNNLISSNAACPAQGSIAVDTTGMGGVHPYTYRITAGPLTPLPTLYQAYPSTFTNLPAGTFTVEIKDSLGNICSAQATIASTYDPMSINLTKNGCYIKLDIIGGKGPYKIERFDVDPILNPGATPVQTINNYAGTTYNFKNVTPPQAWVKVTDFCGFPYLKTIYIGGPLPLPSSVSVQLLNTDSLKVTLNNPAPSIFTYKIYVNGVFTDSIVSSNPEVIFQNIIQNCTIGTSYVTITDTVCKSSSYVFNLPNTNPVLKINCVNAAAGTVNVSVVGGTPPYTFTLTNNNTSSVYTSTTGNFVIPPFSSNTQFLLKVTDFCGKTDSKWSYGSGLYPYAYPTVNCATQKTNLTLGVSTVFMPITAKVGSVTTTYSNGNFTLSDLPTGSFVVELTDNCGNKVFIKDTMFIDITTSCNNFVASISNYYIKIVNGSVIGSTSIGTFTAIYTLLDNNGSVVATNTTGDFSGLPYGDYTLNVTTNCGLSASKPVTLTAPLAGGTAPAGQTYYACTNGTITGTYYVTNNGLGPYILTSTTPPYTVINAGAGGYTLTNIPMGTYNLSSCAGGSFPITFTAPTKSKPNVYKYTKCLNGQFVYNVSISGNYLANGPYIVTNSSAVVMPSSPGYYFPNLPLGTYYITTNNGCELPDTITLTAPPMSTITNDVIVECVNGQYSYKISANNYALKPYALGSLPSVGGAGMVFSGVPPGTYTLASGCALPTTITLPPLPVIPKITGLQSFNCPGNIYISGSATSYNAIWAAWQQNVLSTTGLNLNVPSSNATFTLTNALNVPIITSGTGIGDFSVTYTSLAVGSYILKLKICNAVIDSQFITIKNYISPTATATRGIVCDNATTAKVYLFIKSNTPPFKIEKITCGTSPTVLQTIATTSDSIFAIPDLPIGDHCFRVIDACGVGVTTATQVALIGQINPNFTKQCGGISLTVDKIFQGTYKWYDVNNPSVILSTTDSLYVAGQVGVTKYKVEIFIPDANCTLVREVTFPGNTGLIPAIDITNTVTTFCTKNAVTLNAVVTNGVTVSSIKWKNASGAIVGSGSSANVLVSGLYKVFAYNQYGCYTTDSINILIPSQVLAATTATQNVACYGKKNGTVTVNAVGGFPPYSYNGNVNNIFSNLSVGTYNVTITDNKACTAVTTASVGQPQPLGIEVKQNNPSNCSAYLVMTPTGGTAPYKLFVNGTLVATTPFMVCLKNGSNTILLKDNNDCDTTFNYIYKKSNLPSISKNIELCYGGSYTHAGVVYNKTGVFSQVVSSTVNCGTCDTTVQLTIKVYDKLAITMIPTKAMLCIGGKTDIVANCNGGKSPYTYVWSLVGNTSNTVQNVGQGTYTVTITDGLGCKEIQSITIIEHDFPVVNITGDDKLCKGGKGALQANVTNNKLDNSFTYNWNLNGQYFANTQSVITSKAGTYTVTVTNATTTCTATESFPVTDSDKWIPEIITNKKLCKGASVTLEAKVGAGTQITWYKDNVVLPLFNNQIIITVTEAGSYHIDVKKGLCEGTSDIFNVVIYDNPVLEITPPEKTICPNDSTTVKAICATAISYAWTNGSAKAEIKVTSGVHSVTVVDANGCKASKDVIITNFNTIKPDFEPIKQLCSNKDSISIVSKGIFDAYKWNTGSTKSNIKVTQIGVYTLTVTDKNGCTTTNQVEVKNAVVAQPILTGVKQICTAKEGKVSLQNSTDFKSFAWQDGDTKPNYIVKDSQTLIITTTDFNGCIATTKWNVSVLAVPKISFVVPKVCEGKSGEISVVQNDYTYQWNDKSTKQNLVVSQSGTYYVTITDKNACTNEGFTVFETKKKPSVSIDGSSQICKGDTVLLSAKATDIKAYKWNTLDTTAQIKASQSQTYSLTVTDNNGCIGSSSIILSYADSLKPALLPVKICKGHEAILDAGKGYSDYFWPHNGAKTSTTTANKAGNYRVFVKSGNCEGSGLVELIVFDNPKATIKVDKDTICNGALAQLSTDFGGIVRWSSGEFGIKNITKKAGTYSLFVEDNNGCKDTSHVLIIEKEPFTPTMPDVTVCVGKEATLIPTLGIKYTWENGNTTATLKTSIPDKYSVTVTDKYDCEGVASAKISNFGSVTASINTSKTSLCIGEKIDVLANSNTPNSTFQWSNNATSANIKATQGTYTVTITDNNTCTASASIVLKELPQVSVKMLIDKTKICRNEQAKISILWTGLAQNTANLTLRIGKDLVIFQNVSKDTSWAINPSKSTAYNIQLVNVQGGDCDVFFNKDDVFVLRVSELLATIAATNAICYGQKGSINLTTNAATITPVYVPNANVIAGTYTYKMQDTLGCNTTETIEVKQPKPIDIELALKPTCYGETDGIIDVEVFEGYTPFEYFIDNTKTSSDKIKNLTAGKHIVYISDKNGCKSQTKAVEINTYPITTLKVTADTNYVRRGDSTKVFATIFTDNKTVTDTKAMQFKLFQWSPKLCDECTSFFAKPTISTTYTLSIIDKNGCKANDKIEIEAGEVKHCYDTPTGVTDDDNWFTILDPCNTIDKINVLEVFDQWGNKLYRENNFKPNREIGWDGTYRGQKMNPGVYAWRAIIVYIDGYTLQVKGDVTVVK